MSYKDGGYHNKFTVYHTETGDEIKQATFTLLPECDPHARVALATYAESVRFENTVLSNELYALLGSIGNGTS